jgi:LmbE family N-acetylglucosaminyl deacetylase
VDASDPTNDAKTGDGEAGSVADGGTSDDAPADGGTCAVRELNVLAHQDDELLFLNPDLAASLTAGHCVQTVFLTAGDAGRDVAYSLTREMAIRSVYAKMSGLANDWTESTATFSGKTLRLATLKGGRVALVFFRLPDGGDGTGFPAFQQQSMTKLVAGMLSSLVSIDQANTFTQNELVASLAAIMEDFRPDVIHLQEFLDEFGGDHPDHVAGATMANTAQVQYQAPHRVLYHRGYDLAANPSNLPDQVANPDWDLFLAYAQQDSNVCPTPCPTGDAHPPANAMWRVLGLYYDWVHQHVPYFKGSIVGYGGKCLTVRSASAGAAVDLETCAAVDAQTWTLASSGHLQALGLCLETATGSSANGTSLQMVACATATQRWTYGQVPIGDAGLVTSRWRGIANKCMEVSPSGAIDISDCVLATQQEWFYYAGH